MRLRMMAPVCALTVFAGAGLAQAQTWTGGYAGGAIGGVVMANDSAETVTFDTNSLSRLRIVIFLVTGVPAGSSTIAKRSSVVGVVSAVRAVILVSAMAVPLRPK